MKKLGLVMLLVAAVASPAMADQITVYGGPYQNASGGEFKYDAVNPNGWLDLSGYAASTKSGNSFQTFCIETGEHLNFNNTYWAEITPNAMYGGNYPSGDPISVGTGWLYKQFAKGTLANYFTASRLANAGALQNTIWWLEGEAGDPGPGNIFRQAVLGHFVTAAAAKADGGWAYGVYAVNNWTSKTVRDQTTVVQDGLYYKVGVPDGGTTLMLLGGALMGLGALRRKFRQ